MNLNGKLLVKEYKLYTNMFSNFKVNTLSHFHTVRTFLPGMLEEGHGTIVTVSSVLGYLGCANLCESS
jgi:short-subunit dehydrogenase